MHHHSFRADKKDLPSQLPGNCLEILTSDLFQDSATLALNTPGQDIFDVLHQMKSNNGQRLLFTEQQAWDCTAPSDTGSCRLVLFAGLFIIMNHLLAQIPSFFLYTPVNREPKWSWHISIHSWTIDHPSSLRKTPDPHIPVKNSILLTAVCSVNCNNYESIVKLLARHQWTRVFVDVKSRWNVIKPNWSHSKNKRSLVLCNLELWRKRGEKQVLCKWES